MRTLLAVCTGIAALVSAGMAWAGLLVEYGRLPVMDDVVLSPSGDRYAFVATVKGERKLYVLSKKNEPLAIMPITGVKVRGLEWAGESYVLVKMTDHVNSYFEFGMATELRQIVALNVETHVLRPLAAGNTAGFVIGEYGYRQYEGKWVGYVGAWHVTRDMWGEHVDDYDEDLVRVDLETGRLSQIVAGTERADGWLVGPDGTVMANARYTEKSGEWVLYAGRGTDRVLARDKDPHHRDGIEGAGRTPGTVTYYLEDDDGGGSWYEIALAGSQAPVELLPDARVDAFLHDRGTGLLIGYVEKGDLPRPVLFDPAKQKRIDATRKAFPNLRVGFKSWSDDFNRMIVHTDGPGDSGTFWIVDIATGHAEDIGFDYPAVKPEAVGKVSVVDFKAADGMELHGVLTLPPGREPRNLPVVVLPHGGPEARDYPSFDWWAQGHASRGYAVWQPNFRGSAGYGADYRNAGFGEWGGRMQTDVSDGLAELVRRGIVDPKRACIVGASYGGYAALAGVTVQQGLYRCAVSVAGPSDLRPWLRERRERFGEASVRYFLRYLGSTSAWDTILDQRSPARLAERADAPVLLIHGRDDTVVPFEQSKLMKKALESAGKPVEMIALDGEDHWLSREPTRLAMLDAVEAFVEKYNPP